MVVSLHSPFAMSVGGIPHAYQGVSDNDGMHHYRFYLHVRDMGLFLASLQHVYDQYAGMRAGMSEIALSVFWGFRYHGRHNFETCSISGMTLTRYFNAYDALLRSVLVDDHYEFEVYALGDSGWEFVRRRQHFYDALRDARVESGVRRSGGER